MNIASLEAHTTLNTYNLWKLALRGPLNTDARTRDRTRNFLLTRTRCRNRAAIAPHEYALDKLYDASLFSSKFGDEI